MKKIVAINTSSFALYDQTPLNLLADAGFEIQLNSLQRKLTAAEVIENNRGAYGLIAGTEPLHREVLRALPGLKIISRCGSGMDNVDQNEARRLGIAVFNTPDGPTAAVAELTIGVMISLLRKINPMDADMRRSVWKKRMGHRLGGKKVGIIGFGKIGARVALLLHGFGCDVAYCDPHADPQRDFRAMDKLSLLEWADIVTLHAGSSDLLVSRSDIQKMRRGGWLVNMARGELVDEAALYDALVSGHLSGAAMDVFQREPYHGKLTDLENILLTPHAGSYAMESRIQMEIEAVEHLIQGSSNL